MQSKLKKIIGLAIAICYFASSSAIAQTINGNITGTVLDQQGAAIVGATVTATNTETGLERTVITNDEGRFSVNALAVGVYRVKVEATNFAASTTENVQVNTSQNTELNINVSTTAVRRRLMLQQRAKLSTRRKARFPKSLTSRKF